MRPGVQVGWVVGSMREVSERAPRAVGESGSESREGAHTLVQVFAHRHVRVGSFTSAGEGDHIF